MLNCFSVVKRSKVKCSREVNSDLDQWELNRSHIVDFDLVLNRGQFSDVVRAKLTGFPGRRNSIPNVAVKIPNPTFFLERTEEDLRREVRILKELTGHPHIVELVGCVLKQHPCMIVYDYCSENDLLSFLKLNITNIQLLSFAWQISDGLLFLSSKGFVHRAIKARNILIQNKDVAKIGDFGLARSICELKESNNALGEEEGAVRRWMSLEALMYHEFSPRSDVWSFAILLHELMSGGQEPYLGIEDRELESYLRSGKRLEKASRTPDAVYALQLRCWAEDPGQRPSFRKIKELLAIILERESGTDEYYIALEQNRRSLTL